jgi:threonine dehydrogenase-like Zn-dependent dehydrogenase
VAIFAQGPVGLMATVGASLRGAGLVIGVESMPNRIALAEEVRLRRGRGLLEGRPRRGDQEGSPDGMGVDTAIEALGSPKTFAACVSATRPGGTISNIGYHGDGDTVPIPRLDWGVGMSDKTIRTALCPGGSERMGRLLRLIESGRVTRWPMTTHRFKRSRTSSGRST